MLVKNESSIITGRFAMRVIGNLCIQELLFTIYPNYSISLADANISQSIGLVFNLDKLQMQELKCYL